MKSIKTIGPLIIIIFLAFGCQETEKDPAGQRNVAVVPLISAVNPGIFDSKDLQNAYVQFVVSIEPVSKVDKIDIVGSYKDILSRVKITEVTTFPDTVRILSSDVAGKLGIPLGDISNGDVFTFELLTTANGLTTRSNSVLIVSVACAYDTAQAIGNYHSVSADWGSDGNIIITSDPQDPYTVFVTGLEAIEGVDEDQGPLVMHINPATFAVIADKTIIASSAFGYTNLAYEGTGTYNSCDGSYAMTFDISVDQGDFGKFGFTFTRN